jgi:hypothetical protein
MKYTILVASLLFAMSTAAEDRPVADADLVQEYKAYCMEIAEDEGTGKLSIDEFLLSCINDELESEGYQPIASVPK